MLKTVSMTNFRKHERKTINFTEGLNVMKAPNEGGKSTAIEAVLYALYGAKALRTTLGETVTWGRKETELKVELVIELDGRSYLFTRHKGGAECSYDGGLVTGQNEVTAFAIELLGADANTANRLMLANQASLRGALEEGPKAVSTMIESLADFDLFDRLLEAAQTKLLQGPTASCEARVQSMKEALVAPEAIDTKEIDYQIGQSQSLIEENNRRKKPLEEAKDAAQAAYQSAQTQQRMYEMLVKNLTKAQEDLALHIAQQADAQAKAEAKHESIAGLKQQYAEARDHSNLVNTFDVFQNLVNHYPDSFWEGTKESFEAEVADTLTLVEEAVAKVAFYDKWITKYDGDIRTLSAKVVNSSTCPTCGADVSKNPTIVENNAKLLDQIEQTTSARADAYTQHDAWKKTVKERKEYRDDLQKVREIAGQYETFATKFEHLLDINYDVYPPMLKWKGEVPGKDGADLEDLQKRIAAAESAKEAAERANARFLALTETIKEDGERIANLEQQLADTPQPPDVGELHDQARQLGNQIACLKIENENLEAEVVRLGKVKVEVEVAHRHAVERYEQAKSALVEAEVELAKLNFNNALIKKVRAARPLIADKLWNTVLASVSTLFSQMRGEKSVIAKGKDGFTCNGETVTALSGSTLDLLGLAIRVALVKTFLPHTSFLVLDEPSAACDADRTASMLGFIATCGFKQTLLVSHEEASESAADNLITI